MKLLENKYSTSILRFVEFLVILLVLIGASSSNAAAQQPLEWSSYEAIPGYADATLPPYMVADRNRTVHAFTSQPVGDNNPTLGIIYSQWTLEGGWTKPIDILLAPVVVNFQQARLQGVFLDKNGIIHLVFWAGSDTYAEIYYSRAPVTDAGNARAWSAPEKIGWNALVPDFAALDGDNQGNLVVVYSGDIERVGLYAIYSSDGGHTWSDPEAFFYEYNDDLLPAWLDVHMGQSGHLYAVWNTVNMNGHNIVGYFANFDISRKTWSEPTEFTEGIGIESGMGIMNTSVIEYNNEILIRYNNGIPPTGVPPTEWFQKSIDGGKTWTPPSRISARNVGRNGIGTFIIDSANNLHVLFANRVNSVTSSGQYTAIGGMWYSAFQNGRWTEPYLVAKDGDRGSEGSNAAYGVKAILVQRNIILATWRGDPGQVPGGEGVWFAYAKLDAPELPVVIPPTPTAMPTASSTPEPASAPTIANAPTRPSSVTLSDDQKEYPPTNKTSLLDHPLAPLVAGIIPVALIIIIFFVGNNLTLSR